MAKSTVKWWNATKGFGFIESPDGGGDIFVHHTVIRATGRRDLVEGETVEYEAEAGPKGRRATTVRRVTDDVKAQQANA